MQIPASGAASERLRDELLSLQVSESATSWKVVDSNASRLHRDVSYSLALAVRAAIVNGTFDRELDYQPRRAGSKVGGMWEDPYPISVSEQSARDLKTAERNYERCARQLLEQSERQGV